MGNEFQPGTEAFRNVKDQINKEGWQRDDDGDGEAAVFIGTKEEAEEARARLESKEATFADLRSYIAVNSVVVAEQEEIKEIDIESSRKFQEVPAGIFVFLNIMSTKPEILFKSKDGSLKKCALDLDRIGGMDEYKELLLKYNHDPQRLAEYLKQIGFKWSHIKISDMYHDGGLYEELIRARVKKLATEKAGQKFEF